ncbi:hypothetical protein [Bosea sp. (in: a-proteobacteria)]|jgi:hypothetical protein
MTAVGLLGSTMLLGERSTQSDWFARALVLLVDGSILLLARLKTKMVMS